MGQGGRINLINGTPFMWRCVLQNSYQMQTWDFKKTAEVIAPGQVKTVYIEWKEGALIKEADDSGDARYVLEGTPYAFWIQARASKAKLKPTPDYNLRIHFPDIGVYNFPKGSIMNLGWNWNGQVNFLLTGDNETNFSSNIQPTAWMQQNLTTLGNKNLRQLCIPGAHNAGISVINGQTAFIHPNNVLCQTKTVKQQLELGWRYFDIRPTISGGRYLTGHYSKINQLNSWQGANGQSITDIINDINDFTANNKELIILNLSHDYDTDLGNENYAAFTQTKWSNLFERLSKINYLFTLPNIVAPGYDPKTLDLTTLKLSTFIGGGDVPGGSAAVVIVFEPNDGSMSLGDYHLKGFYNHSQLAPYNNYSDTNNTEKMITDQLTKMKNSRPNPRDNYFLLSWTMTQDGGQAVGSIVDNDHSILALARQANPLIFTRLLGACVPGVTWPNILYVDDVADQQITALALVINNVFAKGD